MLIDDRTVQNYLATKGLYKGRIDGDYGPASKTAARALLASLGAKLTTYEKAWDDNRVRVGVEQAIFESIGQDLGIIDGRNGPRTQIAMERWQDKTAFAPPKIVVVSHQPTVFPRQKDMEAFYGKPGENHTRITPPYPVFYGDTQVKNILINERCAESASRILEDVLAEYGLDGIKKLDLDDFGGCYNNRVMRNGKTLSTHAYAAAWDWDADRNQLRWTSAKAQMAKAEYRGFVDAHYKHGWISLGRERNYDWMHFQAARL